MSTNRLISKVLSIALTIQMVCIPNIVSAKSEDKFYDDVLELVSDNWSGEYIDSIELTLGEEKMTVNGDEEEIDPGRGTAPIIENDRTLLPIRAIVETLGGSIDYDDGKIVISDQETAIETTIGSDILMVNGTNISLGASSKIVNDRTMIPVRGVTEALQCDVSWDQDSKTVSITRDFQFKRLIVKSKSSTLRFDEYNPSAVIQNSENLYIVQFETISETKRCYSALANRTDVEYIEPDIIVMGCSSEKATKISNGWGFERTHIRSYAENLSEKAKNEKVKVAVLDSGIDTENDLFSGRILDGGINASPQRGSSSNIYDKAGHGTQVSGIIAVSTEGTNIGILPIKVFNEHMEGTVLTVSAGISKAREADSDIINMSLSVYKKKNNLDLQHLRQSTVEAINEGIVVVTAAGNVSDGGPVACSPADVEAAITVGALNENDAIWSDSNRISTTDVVAPGVDINTYGLRDKPESVSGTSFAAPFVTAAAAMIKAENPSYNPAEIEETLKKHVDKKENTKLYGAGILSMKTSISDGGAPTPTSSVPPIIDDIVSYKWSTDKIELVKGETQRIKLYAIYKNGKQKDVTSESELYSENKKIAAVTIDGVVEGTGTGKTTVYFDKAVGSGVTMPKPLEITVKEIVTPSPEVDEVVSYSWSVQNIELQKGTSENIKLYANYASGKKADVTSDCGLYSNNENIASVEKNGKVIGKSTGKTTIYFDKATGSGVTMPSPLNITVVNKDVITGISFLNKAIGLGDSYQIEPIITPSSASVSDLIWSSSNPHVATVDANGLVTAISEGYTDITAKTQIGSVSWTRRISVVGASMDDFSVNLDQTYYKGDYDEDIPIEIIVKTPDEYVQGSHKYTLWTAYLDNGEWQQVTASYIDGGSAKISYKANAKEMGVPEGSNSITFAVALFDSNNFTTGAAISGQSVLVIFNK